MGGSVEFFTGCAAAAFRQISQLNHNAQLNDETKAGPPDYRTPFVNWDNRASVHANPRRALTDGTAAFFPVGLGPNTAKGNLTIRQNVLINQHFVIMAAVCPLIMSQVGVACTRSEGSEVQPSRERPDLLIDGA